MRPAEGAARLRTTTSWWNWVAATCSIPDRGSSSTDRQGSSCAVVQRPFSPAWKVHLCGLLQRTQPGSSASAGGGDRDEPGSDGARIADRHVRIASRQFAGSLLVMTTTSQRPPFGLPSVVLTVMPTLKLPGAGPLVERTAMVGLLASISAVWIDLIGSPSIGSCHWLGFGKCKHDGR